MNEPRHVSLLGLLLLCCLLTSHAGRTAAANLLSNGDFEKGLEGWQITKPPGGKVDVVKGPKGNCARLKSTDRSGSTYLTQPLNAEALRGQRIRVQAMVKAEGVVVGTYPYSQAKITLVWSDGQTETQPEVDFLDSFDWRRVSVVWNIGDNCKSAVLYLGMHTTTGTVWFDDVSVTVPQLRSERPVEKDITERVYDDGTFYRVNGRDFCEMKPVSPVDEFRPTQAEEGRGFVVFLPEEPTEVVPGRQPIRKEVVSSFDLMAAPDQYEPVVFAVSSFRPLEGVGVSAGKLVGPKGAGIPSSAFDVRMGRQVIQRMTYTGPEYHTVPKLLVPARPATVEPGRPQLYWLTLHVPPTATAGMYSGSLRVTADGKSLDLPLRLRVLPFRLVKSKPWMLYFYNDHPDDAELYFRDMRQHGMTSVILAQVMAPLKRDGDRAVTDFASSDAFVAAYRKAGFTDPIVYNPFHDRLATKLLELWGMADRFPKVVNYGESICVFKEGEYPESLQQVYRQVVRDLHDHAKQAGWPPMLFYPVDEPNSPEDWRLTAARLEYRLTKETVPTARMFCTVYSIAMMERLDPWLDVRACHILHPASSAEGNKSFQDYLSRAGGEVWGIEWPAMWDDFWRARELGGFLPAKAGVTGMTAWTYYNPGRWTDEYHDLRGEYKQCLLVYRDADGGLIPTVTWEGLRAGVTDWQYIATLEAAIVGARGLTSPRGTKRQRAERALREVLTQVPWRSEAKKGWGNRRASELRAKIAKAIVEVGQ